MKRVLLLPFLILFFSLTCRANHENLLNKTFAERATILKAWYHENALVDDSLTCFNYINAIAQTAKKHGDKELELETELMKVYYYTRHERRDTQFCLDRIEELRQAVTEQNNILMLAAVEGLAGYYAWEALQNYELSFEHCLREYDIIKNISYKEYPHKQFLLYKLGENYYFFRDYENAIYYLKKLLAEQAPEEMWDYLLFQSTNTIGLCYRNLNQPDSSDHYFRKIYRMAESINNTVWKGIANGNLGHNFFLRGDYASAVPLLENDVELSMERKDWGCASGAEMTLAEINLSQNKIAAASALLEKAKDWVNRSGQYERREQLFPLLSKLYMEQGKTDLAKRYLDSSIIVKDSLMRKHNSLQLLRAGQRNELQKHHAEIAGIEDQKQIKTLQRNALIGILVILCIFSLYIYTLQRNRHQKKQQLLDLQLKEKENQLEIARLKLTDFTINIYEKSKLVEELQQKLEGSNNASLVSELQQQTILTDEEWDNFRALFDQVHIGFIQRMREKIPGVTPGEMRFMVLAKLKFSNKEMAHALGISPQTIRVTWHRLRKKLNLPEESSIEDLVDGI